MRMINRTLSVMSGLSLLLLAGCAQMGQHGNSAPATNTTPATPPAQTAPATPPAPQAPPATASSVQMFVGQLTSAPGLQEVKLADGAIYINPTPVLFQTDLDHVQALQDQSGNSFVGLRFNQTGSKKLSQISAQHVGDLLAMVVNGELVAAPRIAGPLDNGVLAFHVASSTVAMDIANRIKAGMPATSGPSN